MSAPSPDADLSRFSYLHLKHRRIYNAAPSRKWCKFPTSHEQHLFSHQNGLVYFCGGTKTQLEGQAE